MKPKLNFSKKKLNGKKSDELVKQNSSRENECFKNSMKAIIKFNNAIPNLIYVEGFCISKQSLNAAFLHGWLEDEKYIYDVTLGDDNMKTKRKYLPLITKTPDEIIENNKKNKKRYAFVLLDEDANLSALMTAKVLYRKHGCATLRLEDIITNKWLKIHHNKLGLEELMKRISIYHPF